ncbi:hypothetical protein pb186bvf_005921 [Paramecium bursaria]
MAKIEIMNYVRILGIAEKVKKQAKDVIKLMNKYQITTWMASGDSLDKVLPIAYSTKLLDENMTVVHFFQDPQSLIKQQIQNIYNQVKNQKTNKINRQGLTGNLISPSNINRRQSMKKRQSVNLSRRISTRGLPFITQQEELKIKSFAILISGSILEKIARDQNLFEHFSFLVFFSNQLIGYRMTAYQKYILLDLIQNQQGSKKRVLAIGDQINDSIMFKYADYSLQIRHDRVFQDTKFDKVEQLVRAKSGGPRNSKSKSFLRAIRFLYQLNKSLYEYIQIVSNTDIVIKNIKEIPKLLFYESKLHAELFENLINHSFYRQYLIGFVVFFLFCFQKQPSYLPIGFFLRSLFYTFRFCDYQEFAIQTYAENIFLMIAISKYYQQNQINFRKKRFKKFLYKVIFFSFIEALIISIIHVNIQFIDENGLMLDDKLLQYQLITILLIMELTKLLQIKYWILTIIILMSYFSLLNISFLTNYYEEYNFYSILTATPSILFILLMTLIFYVFQLLFNSIEGLQVETEISGDLDDDEIKQMTHVISIMYKQAQRDKDYELNLISSLVNKIFKTEDSIDINIKQMLSGITFAEKSANISIFNQQFINKQLEFKYQQFQRPNSILFNTYYIPLSWIMLEGVIFIQLLTLNDFGWFFYLSISYNCLAILYVLGIPFGLLRKYVWQYSKILILSRAIYKIIYDINFFQNNQNGLNDMVIMQFFMIQPVFDNDPMIFVFYQLAIVVSFYVRYSSINSSQDIFIDYYIMISYYIISLIQMVLMIWIFYKMHRQYREQYILKFKKLQKISQMTDTLAILMPKFIRNKINESNTLDYNIEIQQGQVAILFCDICGFDQIISDLKENVVVLLDQLFRQFDSLCPQYKLQKIETVGKTYMAAAGINEMNQNLTNPVFRAVQMAMEMINQAQSCKYQNIDNVVVKIGIHYGYVIAGVIGDHKPQFSLIGDTVNTTSRLCSTGQDGQIIISEQAYYQIQQVTIWRYKSNIVEAKGKGKLCTFIVEKEKIEGKKKLKQLKKYKSEQSNKIQFPITRSPNNISDDTQTRKISSIDRPKKPSFVAPSLKLMVPLPHKSSLNLEQHSSGYNKSSHQGEEVAAQPQQKTYEGKDLIESLELKLQKDNIIVESGIQFPSYEADREKLRKLYQNEDEDQQQQDVLILDKRKLYLDFSDDTEDIDLQIFKDQTINQGYNQTLLLSFLSSFLIIIQTSLMIMVQEVYYNRNLWIIILIMGYTLPLGQITFLIYSITNRSNGFIITEQYFGIISIFQYLWWLFSTLSVVEFDIGEIYISFGVILQLFHQFTPMFQIKYKLLYGLVLGLSIIFVVLIKQWNLILIFYGLMEILLTSAVQYYTFYMSVKEYNQIQEIDRKYLKQDELIKHQLPKHILDKFLLQSQERQILTEIFDDVTLLFADIAGFTEYSSSVQPEQVVQMLRKLFMEFDQICQTNNCYKLYTIGDCYVVMGMVDALDRNQAQEAKNIIEMGFEMINKIKEVRNNINFTELDMRIGVHTGSIIGGVLGTDIVRYDIYGPDVLIANKMESKGQKGKVHISGRTKEIIETCFSDEYTISYSTTINLDSIDRKVVGFFIDRRSECDVSLEEQKQYSQ